MELKSVKETWDAGKLERWNTVKINLIGNGWSSDKLCKSVESQAQKRISSFLSKCQIHHQTEVDLDGVDRPVNIFIPPMCVFYVCLYILLLLCTSFNIADSQTEPLACTYTEARHLTELGYHFVSIHYSNYIGPDQYSDTEFKETDYLIDSVPW